MGPFKEQFLIPDSLRFPAKRTGLRVRNANISAPAINFNFPPASEEHSRRTPGEAHPGATRLRLQNPATALSKNALPYISKGASRAPLGTFPLRSRSVVRQIAANVDRHHRTKLHLFNAGADGFRIADHHDGHGR